MEGVPTELDPDRPHATTDNFYLFDTEGKLLPSKSLNLSFYKTKAQYPNQGSSGRQRPRRPGSLNADPDIVSKLFLPRKRIIPEHPAGRPTSDHCT